MKKYLLPIILSCIANYSFADSNSTIIVAGTAKVNSTCTISILPIDFGIIVSNSQNQNSTTLTATCTKGTAFNIDLSTGNSNTFTNRYMNLNNNQEKLNYNIYIDSSYNNILGNGNDNTVMISNIGTGEDQNFTIYGKIPTGQYVIPGVYNDLITATLSY